MPTHPGYLKDWAEQSDRIGEILVLRDQQYGKCLIEFQIYVASTCKDQFVIFFFSLLLLKKDATLLYYLKSARWNLCEQS